MTLDKDFSIKWFKIYFIDKVMIIIYMKNNTFTSDRHTLISA